MSSTAVRRSIRRWAPTTKYRLSTLGFEPTQHIDKISYPTRHHAANAIGQYYTKYKFLSYLTYMNTLFSMNHIIMSVCYRVRL